MLKAAESGSLRNVSARPNSPPRTEPVAPLIMEMANPPAFPATSIRVTPPTNKPNSKNPTNDITLHRRVAASLVTFCHQAALY